MLHSIVVPLDGTPESEIALPHAERIARASGARLHLVRVVPQGDPGVYPHEGTGLPSGSPRAETDAARAALDELRTALSERGSAPVETAVLTGDVVSALEEYALDVAADGFVMASRTPGVMGRALLGSVADQVVRAAAIPVLVVPTQVAGRHWDPPRILVALDGTTTSEGVVPLIGKLAPALGARVTLLRVLAVRIEGGHLPSALVAGWEHDMHEADAYVLRWRDRLRGRGVRTDAIVLSHPSPDEAIAEVAHEIGATMIAMGTRGQTGLRSMVMGSVARGVIPESPCPVLVLRTQ